MNELVSKFQLPKEEFYYFVRNQYRFLENLRLEFRFIKADKDSSKLLFRLEEELLKSLDFINLMTSYPFAIDLNKNPSSLKRILSLIEYLENVVECMFIYENEVIEEKKRLEEQKEQDRDNYLDDENEESDNQFEADPSLKPEDNQLGKSKTFKNSKIMVRSTIIIKKPGKKLKDENSQFMAALCCKIRTSFLLHVSMILLSFLIKKFEFIRPLLHDLRALLHKANEQASEEYVESDSTKEADDKRQSLANIQIYLKNLKEIAISMLYQAEGRSLKPKVKDEDESSDDADDPFLRNFRQNDADTEEEKEKKKKDEEQKKKDESEKKRLELFLILWLRQIVIYNCHYVLHLALINENMTTILDVRPSIVKATSIKYSLISLMNPRLQAFQQVNNIKSMKRVIDNTVTYFFQNFISTKERAMVVEDLQKVRNNLSKIENLKNLKIAEFFESNEEFIKFCSFMDLNYYIGNVAELELSLICHTNKDYSATTLKRVKDVYKNGIEIFKSPGEHITQICFDKSKNDIMAFTMKEEGIREIKLLQSLTLRNRTEAGLEVFDHELDNWSDCLHRYDNYPKEDAMKSQYEVITGAVTKLYKEKTINYSKIKRTNKSHIYQYLGGKSKTLLCEIEPKPPQFWNGEDSSEYLKMGPMKNSLSQIDYSTCITAHPMLPIYVTGNNKGKL